MDKQDIRTLKILEEIESDKKLTQRDLSRELHISLGLVNSFVKRLVHKGYFKIKALPKNRVRYILTPEGAAEKTRLTYQYIQFSFKFYRESREELRKLFKYLTGQGVRRVVFYGVSDFAEIAYISLKETPIQMVSLVDEEKKGEKFLNFVVSNPAILSSLSFDRILITSIGSKDVILERILKQGISRDRVIIWDV